jgi:hypothetical protein
VVEEKPVSPASPNPDRKKVRKKSFLGLTFSKPYVTIFKVMRDRNMNQKEYSQKRHNEALEQYNAGVKQSDKVENEAKAEVEGLYEVETEYGAKRCARQFVDFLEETF